MKVDRLTLKSSSSVAAVWRLTMPVSPTGEARTAGRKKAARVVNFMVAGLLL
jgi:hypothetical protein